MVRSFSGTGSPTSISFPATRGRFIRISLTASADDAPAWVVRNVRLYRAPAGPDSR